MAMTYSSALEASCQHLPDEIFLSRKPRLGAGGGGPPRKLTEAHKESPANARGAAATCFNMAASVTRIPDLRRRIEGVLCAGSKADTRRTPPGRLKPAPGSRREQIPALSWVKAFRAVWPKLV